MDSFVEHAIKMDLLDIFLSIQQQSFDLFDFLLHQMHVAFQFLQILSVDCGDL